MQTMFTDELNLQLNTMLMDQLLYLDSWKTEQVASDGKTQKEESILSNEKFLMNHFILFKLYTDKLREENEQLQHHSRDQQNVIQEMRRHLSLYKQKIVHQKFELDQRNDNLQELQEIEELVIKGLRKKFNQKEPVKLHLNLIKEHQKEQNNVSSINSKILCFEQNNKSVHPLQTKLFKVTKNIAKVRSPYKRLMSNIRGPWNLEEQNRFLEFVDTQRLILLFPQRIAQNRSIFSKMSNFIRTRTVAQCQKHHVEHLIKRFDYIV